MAFPRLDFVRPAGYFTCASLAALLTALSGAPVIAAIALLTLAVALWPAVRLVSGRETDPFAPIHLFVLYIVLTVLVRGAVVAAGDSGILSPLYAATDPEFVGLLGAALLATALFLLCLYAGYYGRVPQLVSAPVPRLSQPPFGRPELAAALLFAAVVAIPVGVLLFSRIGAAVAAGRFTTETRAGGIFWMGFLLRLAVLGGMLPFVFALQRRIGARLSWRAAFAIAIAFAVFLLWPKKIVMANQVLGLLVCYHYLRTRIRVRWLVVAGILALLALPILSAFRYWGLAGLSPAKLAELAALAVQHPSFLVRDLLVRSFGADSLILILDQLRATGDYQFGATFMDSVRWFVPRAFWPDKPPTYAIVFGQQFLARTAFFSVNVSGTPTIIGELLLNFGLVGVISGGYATGVCLRVPYSYLIERGPSLGSVFLYSVFLAGAVMIVEGPLWPQVMDVSISIAMALTLLLVMEGMSHVREAWGFRDGHARRI